MRFADPHACPDCRGVIAGEAVCPRCGLDLTSLEVRQLWQTLLQADELLARATQRRAPAPTAAPTGAPAPTAAPTGAPAPTAAPTGAPAPAAAPAPAPAAEPFSAVPPMWRSYPTPDPMAAPAAPGPRSWSVGTILLVLGAFGLVTAGLIFVTRSWGDIGLAGKTLILLGVTAVIGALGVWVTRRPLRASAEAVWTVFLALLTLDFFAARHEDLVGLGSLSLQGGWIVWGVAALALSVGIAIWASPHVEAALVAPAVAGGLAITLAGIGAGSLGDDWDYAWRAVLALVVAGLMALSTRPAALAPMTLAARIVFGAFFVFGYVAALVELAEYPAIADLVGGGHGGPMVLMVVASAVVAWLVAVVRIPAVALAVLGFSALAIAPVAEAGDSEATWVVAAVLAAVLSVVGARGANDWMRGVRLGAVPAIGGIVLIHVLLLADVTETIGRVLDDPWRVPAGRRLDAVMVDDRVAWVVPVVLVALLVVAWFVPRWPELSGLRSHTVAVVGWAATLGAVDAVVAWRLPVWAGPSVLLALAGAALAAHVGRRATSLAPAAMAAVVAATLLASASQGVSAATWVVGAAIGLAFALAPGRTASRHVYAVLAVALLLAGVAALVDLLEVGDATTSLAVVVVALALMATSHSVLRSPPAGRSIEISAAVGLVAALVTEGSSAEIAVRWTVAGVALIAMGVATAGRRWLVWPGLGALVVAYVALIVDSGFSFVEAYTLPLGAVALGVGLYLARRGGTTSTWVHLGPGLAVALLPSVPQALVDPTDLRALLLGAGSLVVLAVGVRLGWQAPFVAGASILVLLVLFNIGPYANAAPRVVLIAAVSAVLLGVGITWEDRVRDGRRLVGYVRSMR